MIGKERGQSDFAARGIEHKPGVLDRIDEELDWWRFGKTLRKVFKDSKDGRLSYPPVMLFKVLLLQQWYGLSDPMAEEAIGDRLSFRRFLGLGLHDAIADETTICRFRGRLAGKGVGGQAAAGIEPATGRQRTAGQARHIRGCKPGRGANPPATQG